MRRTLGMKDLAATLTALYLRGAPRPVELRRACWPGVLGALRRSGCSIGEASEALGEAGYWAEALILQSQGLLEWARSIVEERRVLTAADNDYPVRWPRVLGPSAPPVLWRSGDFPSLPSVSVVGSRVVRPAVATFCERSANEAIALGFAIVSGRAEGCDRAAARGAQKAGGGLVEILPYGLDLAGPSAGCLLSLCAPDEPFSAAAAMERNALIYAASAHTVVGHARFKEGGTWHGAVSAIRSRLSTLVVRRSEDIAMRSLVALGGVWLDSPSDLGLALKTAGPQRQLFGSAI
ncbi:MAG TPA: DNA-processing protein DprA [Fimbriimonadaceae bacterium]|nr:DNA-processing protein DprA [Fimbriimonadaceae bacterium]